MTDKSYSRNPFGDEEERAARNDERAIRDALQAEKDDIERRAVLAATDRPRVWTVPINVAAWAVAAPERIERARVMEWDREKVEAAVTRTLTELLDRKPESTAYGMARAVFDALDEGDA